MKSDYQEKNDNICYLWGSVLLGMLVIAIPLIYMGIFIPSKHMPPCLFHSLTGLSCPGCGCTRSVLALMRGDILESLRMNPFIIYFLIFYIPFMISQTVARLLNWINNRKLQKKATETEASAADEVSISPAKIYHGMHAKDKYFYLAIALLLTFWVIRLCFEIYQLILTY